MSLLYRIHFYRELTSNPLGKSFDVHCEDWVIDLGSYLRILDPSPITKGFIKLITITIGFITFKTLEQFKSGRNMLLSGQQRELFTKI